MSEEKISTKKSRKKSVEKKTDGEMSFLDHLELLRWHIIKSLAAVVVFGIIAFIFKGFIFDKILLAPREPGFFTNYYFCKIGTWLNTSSLCINLTTFQIINIKMSGQFATHVTVSLVVGFIIAFPYIFREFWKFISPALLNNERKSARGAIFWSSFLFIAGVLFGYFIITPLTISFFNSYLVSDVVGNEINLDSYISIITSVVLSGGAVFELPILIYFLSKAGIVNPEFLKKYRKHAIIIILTLSGIITPPDIFSQIIVTIPLFLLYEVGIILSKRVVKKKALAISKIEIIETV